MNIRDHQRHSTESVLWALLAEMKNPLRILSYVLASDDGQAPNVTGGVCTLAVCKPVIRAVAQPGYDWVVGMSTAKHGEHKLIYAMAVESKISFADFYRDPRFVDKKPTRQNPNGDNAYGENKHGILTCDQYSSHFGRADKMARDLKAPVALMSENFWYFGGNAPEIPEALRDANLVVAKPHFYAGRRGHRVTTDQKVIGNFVEWLKGYAPPGVHGTPRDLKI